MGLTARTRDWEWHVPEFGGNADDPNPTRIEWRPMDPPLWASYQSNTSARIGMSLAMRGPDADLDDIPANVFDMPPADVERIAKRCIGQVENYASEVVETDKDGKRRTVIKPIRNANDLLHRGDPGVVFEMLSLIISNSKLSGLAVKNSTERPGSSSPTPPTMSDDGSAASVPTNSDKPATAPGD